MEVTVTMPYSEKNRAALDKYEELVKKHFWSLKTASSKDSFSHFRSGPGEINIGWYKN